MKTYSTRIRKIKNDEPIYSIPPYEINKVLTPYSQIIDWGLKMFGIPNFWKTTKGESVKVAVLDTGYDTNHSDLKDNVVDAKDFTGSTAGCHDVQGHGTHCAGIIAAKDNSSGVVGVAPQASLFIGKVLGDDGRGTAKSVAEGIDWAISCDVDIISMSLGSPDPSELIQEAINKAIAENIIIICAAGNEGPYLDTVGYPAQFDDVIAVGSIDRNKNISYFSSRGPQVDIVAPGDEILSCYPPNGLAVLSGTSMATPFVTGVAALIISKHRIYSGQTPISNSAEMEQHLRKTAIDLGLSGFDNSFGYGLINPEQLIFTPKQLGKSLERLNKNIQELNYKSSVFHYSNITYSFSCDTSNPLIELNGVEGKKGEKQMLNNVPLYRPDYELEVKIDPRGIGNWKLEFIEIKMINPEYKRGVAGVANNTISGNNKPFERIYKTNEKFDS